jgi:hypothetical protein
VAKNRDDLAELLGAKIVGRVPDVGGGAFGMARLVQLLHERLTPRQGERPGRPTDATWVARPKVPMSKVTLRKLKKLAAQASSNGRKVTATQLAAQLLEEAVEKYQEAS